MVDAQDVPVGYESRVGADGAAHYERTLRSLPRWLVREYLEDLGGRSDLDLADSRTFRLVAAGWQATLEQVDDFQVGSLRVGQVRLTLSGAPASLAPMMAALEKRLFRGGG